MTMTEHVEPSKVAQAATVHSVRYSTAVSPGESVLLEFIDPTPKKAVALVTSRTETRRPSDHDVLVVPGPPGDERASIDEFVAWVAEAGTPPLLITIHGAQVIWGYSRSVLLATPDRVTPFLLAMIDFHYHERELRTLEREVRESWPLLDADRPLARAVVHSDPDAFDKAGERMDASLDRRVRFARITPHLFQPRPGFSPLSNQLLDRLRERTSVEVRHEALAAQLEVFDRVYEMTSQRVSDFKAAQQQRTMEWIIIILLAAETVLLLLELMRSTPTT